MKKINPFYDHGMWKGAPAENFRKAKELRSRMTEAEKLLWKKLQLPPFRQYKFRRQHPLHYFIVDFYSHSSQLIIEVDGQYHESADQKKLDQERSEILQFQGVKEIRFRNEEILGDIDKVLEELKQKIHYLPRP